MPRSSSERCREFVPGAGKGVAAAAFEPRYANLRAIKQAEQHEIAVVTADTGEPSYRVRRMFAPPRGAGAELLDGNPAQIAQRITELLRERLA